MINRNLSGVLISDSVPRLLRGSQRWVALTRALICSLGLLSGCSAAVDLPAAKSFQEAENEFTRATSAEGYLRAAGLYQEILDRGIASGVVLYNQGNAFMKAGQRGRAIAAFRQAQRYRPRDPFLEANLRYALGPDAALVQQRSVIDYLLFWRKWLSYPEKFYWVTGAAALTLVFGLLGQFLGAGLIWNRLALIGIAITLILGVSSGYDWYQNELLQHGVVITAESVARKGNSATYEPAFTAPLREGAELTLLERRGDWLLVRVPNAGDAWIEQRTAVLY